MAAYSTTGASTYIALLALIKHIDTTTKAVSTRASAATFTQTTTEQIDVYWASPPFGLQALKEGKIRLIARGNNTPSMKDRLFAFTLSTRMPIPSARMRSSDLWMNTA